jgi:hypothetical protein
MVRFRPFPRDRKPSLGELLGSSQAARQVARTHKIRIVRDPPSPLSSFDPWAPRHAGDSSEPKTLARLLGRLLG